MVSFRNSWILLSIIIIILLSGIFFLLRTCENFKAGTAIKEMINLRVDAIDQIIVTHNSSRKAIFDTNVISDLLFIFPRMVTEQKHKPYREYNINLSIEILLKDNKIYNLQVYRDEEDRITQVMFLYSNVKILGTVYDANNLFVRIHDMIKT